MDVTIGDIEPRLETHPTLFSPASADKGSLAMLSSAMVDSKDKVLDLGCGYGLVGLCIAKGIGSSLQLADLGKVLTCAELHDLPHVVALVCNGTG